MTNYVEELTEAFETQGKVDKFDALMSILFDHVYNSQGNKTSEEGQKLADQLRKIYYSVDVDIPFASDMYNDEVDLASFNDIQKAYYKGKIGCLLDMVNYTNYARPKARAWELAKERMPYLLEIDEFPAEYDPGYCGEMVEQGIVYYRQSIDGAIYECFLTPLGKDFVEMHKKGLL